MVKTIKKAIKNPTTPKFEDEVIIKIEKLPTDINVDGSRLAEKINEIIDKINK